MTDPSLSDLIEAHHSEVHLSEAQRGRARARLLAQVGAGVAVTSIAGSASGALGTWLAKLTVGLALLGTAGGAYYATRHDAPAAPRLAPAAPAKEARMATPAVVPAVPEPDVVAASNDAPEKAPPNRPATSARAPAPKRSLADEVKTMQEVDAALRSGDPSHALALVDQNGGTDSALKEERAAARVFALCQLGRKIEARAEAARFSQRWPRSPLAARVKSSCPAP